MRSLPIAIIVVTYNGMTWLKQCLNSCADYPVILVDNGSKDETVSFIETNYPNVTLLKQSKNLGFGQANNLGIRYALNHGAEHVLLLNQDAYIIDDALEQLIAFHKEHTEYGILSPIHITGNQQKLDRNFSIYMLREKTGQFYSDFVLSNKLATVYEVPIVNAAAWLLSRECIETTGGFDPLFFHYGEDDNYCQRIAYHGFKIGVLPKAYVIHDREDRIPSKIEVFSDAYFKNVEKNYKVVYGNINIENTLDLKIAKLKRIILKLQLKMKHKRASNFKKELLLLQKIKPLIAKSRELNKKEGTHYL